MLDLTGYGRLAEFIKLTDRMINEASKDAIVNAACMLAIQVGHYSQPVRPGCEIFFIPKIDGD